jgi:hypothetical protein
MRQEAEIHQAYRDLEGLPPHAHDQERDKLERREQGRREALDAEFQALEDEGQQYWAQRQRSDMERNEQEWEAEQQRRREEEGEHFDEEAYQFERGLMVRRRELQGRRMRQEAEIHQAYRDLEGLPPHAHDQEREKLERREQGRREALDAEFQALEEELEEYWAQRASVKIDVGPIAVTYWDFDDFVGALNNEVVIINFDALPTGPAVAPMFNLDKSLAGGPLTGAEWQSLGATFSSAVGAALRTVSTIEHYPPPHMDDPMVDLFVSRPNSLTMGAAPYTPELDPADNNGVVDNNDDSLIIELDPPRTAIGFYLIDQDPGGEPPPPGEGIVFRDVNGNVIKHVQPLPAAIYPNHQFIGVISYSAAIARVEIDESNDADSICIDHVVLSQ